MGIADLVAVAAIIIGFGVTAIMFRLQRETSFREDQRWIAGADYLIFLSVSFGVISVVSLLVYPSQGTKVLARLCCVAAVICLAGYIPAILNHYGISLWRNDFK